MVVASVNANGSAAYPKNCFASRASHGSTAHSTLQSKGAGREVSYSNQPISEAGVSDHDRLTKAARKRLKEDCETCENDRHKEIKQFADKPKPRYSKMVVPAMLY